MEFSSVQVQRGSLVCRENLRTVVMRCCHRKRERRLCAGESHL